MSLAQNSTEKLASTLFKLICKRNVRNILIFLYEASTFLIPKLGKHYAKASYRPRYLKNFLVKYL